MHVTELFDLDGRVAIVTGGATGLGRQMSEALAEAGASVVVCARNAERCAETAEGLSRAGFRALGLGCDVRDPGAIEEVVARTRADLGRVDVLVNNAGTSWGAAPEDVPLDGWRKVLDVNLTGAFLFAQAVGRVLIAQGEGGSIVNIASIAGLRGAAPEELDALPYSTSKGGLIAFTLDLAVKWARHGIRVNAIAPGWFPTELSAHSLSRAGDRILSGIPLGRFGSPDDLKGAVVFLASAASAYVTGQTLVVDGGATAR